MADDELAPVRRVYARQMLAAAGALGNAALERAFATVPREAFVAAKPWVVFTPDGGGPREVPEDPVLLYQNALVALDRSRGVNNGSPVLHARWVNEAVRPGDRVVHVGAGAGYYSAILAEVVGPAGAVLAVEMDARLAEIAGEALRDRANVKVIRADGADVPREPADCIYVNAAVVRPPMAWFERLTEGGRLLFPLGVRRENDGGMYGAALRVERGADGFEVRVLGSVYFVPAEGALAGDDEERTRLREAFARGGVERVRRLVVGGDAGGRSSWYHGPGWSLEVDED